MVTIVMVLGHRYGEVEITLDITRILGPVLNETM